MQVQHYRGFLLSPMKDLRGFRVAIAYPDGRIFALGDRESRCFYTSPFPEKVDAFHAAKKLVDAEMGGESDV